MSFMDKLVSGKELIGVKKHRSQSYIFERFEYELQRKRESEGWIVDKELKSVVRMKRPKPLDEQFEDEVWCLFANLGFSCMNKDRHLEIPYHTCKVITKKSRPKWTALIIPLIPRCRRAAVWGTAAGQSYRMARCARSVGVWCTQPFPTRP